MTHAPRARRGAHRVRRDLTAAIVPSLLAVLTVLAFVAALYVWRGGGSSPQPAAASTSTAHRTPTSSSSPSPSSPSPSASSSSTPAPTTTSAAPKTTAVTSLGVVVLNQTSRAGLAAAVAGRLRARGFTVVGTGNFHGVVPATTVYYPPGDAAAALQVARALPTSPRTGPRFSNLSTTRLTVVVTDNYPG
jgi:cytoskeletal protein RodZ